MPITKFQQQVLTLLKDHRNPESYVAGGTAIQRHPESLRYSADIDIFHDADLAVLIAFNADKAALIEARYGVEVHIAQPSFYRATVVRDQGQVKLEWVRDTAFRFFPVLPDAQLGYRLHDADLAINKYLALANRSEVRDALDMIDLDRDVLSLAAGVCAACGKDPGFTPDLMLDLIQRHINFSPDALSAEALTRPVDAKQLKLDLLAVIGTARATLAKLATADLGFLYIDRAGGQVVKTLDNLDHKQVLRHAGTVKGSWPRIVDRE